MSRRRREEGEVLSLDSFLDIVTNVVGVLILVAVVTVLSAGDITISSGATALRAPPQGAATRLVVECARGQAFIVDEEKNAEKVRAGVADWTLAEEELTADSIVAHLEQTDIGDTNHRVHAELAAEGFAWTYKLRDAARGDTVDELEGKRSRLAERLDELGAGTYVYFVVQEDSFEAYRAARDLVRARGLANGWHPVVRNTPVRMSAVGSLGRRVQ